MVTFFHDNISHEKIDRRRCRDYRKRSSLTVEVNPQAYGFVAAAINQWATERQGQRMPRIGVRPWPYVTGSGLLYIKFNFKANKPSNIISDEDMEKEINKLLPDLVCVAAEAEREADNRQEKENQLKEVQELCERYANHISKMAEKACEYDKKIASLRAEFFAQTALVREEAFKEYPLDEQGDSTRRAVEKNLDKFIKAPGNFRCLPTLKLKDI